MSRAADLHRSTRRFTAYVHWSMYLIVLSELTVVLHLGVSTVISGAPLVGAMLLVVLHTAATLAWMRWSLSTVRTADPFPRRARPWFVGYLLLTVLTCAAVPLTTGIASVWPMTIIVVVALSTSAFAPRLSWWLAPAIPAVTAVLLLAAIYPISGMSPVALVVSILLTTAGTVFLTATFWLSGWMLRVMYALDDARGQSAQLAIAEERLRISRDLHDVFGRTLATVSVKSELAAELARRGRPDTAAEEMAQVRRVSDEAGREVRRIVAGVRDSDLAQELVGARSLLASAGVECRLSHRLPDGLLATGTSAVLGAVVREAVTNVIRHSRARTARIDLGLTADHPPHQVRLTVGNDGVTGRADGGQDGPGGHGLVGMGERLHAVGGTLRHQQEGDTFVLTVDVPVRPPGAGPAPEPDPPTEQPTDQPTDATGPPTDQTGPPTDQADRPTGGSARPGAAVDGSLSGGQR